MSRLGESGVKMYNLLIVEDEKFTRDSVEEFLSEELGLYFNVYTAENGKRALEVMEKINIDVVITDIMMQAINGIELAEIIYQEYKDCIVIIMSGYEEFEYAYKAIKYNVRHYLLKPVDLTELLEKLILIKNEFDEKNKKNEVNITADLSEERERFFVSLVYSGLTDTKKELEKAKKLSLPFDIENTPCDIILLKIEDYEHFLNTKWNYEKDSFTFAVSNLVSGFLKNQHVFCIHSEKGYFEYIVYRNDEEIDYHNLTKKISAIANVTVELVNEAESYQNIRELLKMRKEAPNPEERALIFISHFKEKNYDEAKRILISASENEKIWEKFKEALLEYGLPSEITDVTVWDDIYEKYIDSISENDNGNGNENIFVSIENAKKYIQENYKRNISREEVAKAVYISPAYFTRNFKIYTGENFSDYLLKTRMKNAVRLMKEKKYKVEQIAEMVGYENQK